MSGQSGTHSQRLTLLLQPVTSKPHQAKSLLRLQYSRDAFLHQLNGLCGRGGAAYTLTPQAVPHQHCNWQHNSRCELAYISASCTLKQGAVSHWPVKTCPYKHEPLLASLIGISRLVVVLEKRALVHDLKTLELLRTLETESNPKVQMVLVHGVPITSSRRMLLIHNPVPESIRL